MGVKLTNLDEDQSLLASDEVSQFVGKNATYYQAEWMKAVAKAGSLAALLQLNRPAVVRNRRAGWNWAAFFFGIIWLTYRKMYAWAIFILAMIVAVAVAEELSGKGLLPVYGVAYIMAAIYGNAWYLGHTYSRVTKIQNATTDTGARRLLLANAGGTNLFGAVLVFLGIAIATILLNEAEIDALLSEDEQAPAVAIQSAQSDTSPRSAPQQNERASATPRPLPGWEPWLEEMNAVWGENPRLQLYFSPRYFAIKAAGQPVPLDIIATDSTNDTVTFNVRINQSALLIAGDITPDPKASPEEWTLQRIWNDEHTRFNLALHTPNGSVSLGFVRRLLPTEIEELNAISSNTPTQPPSAQTSQSTSKRSDGSPGKTNYAVIASQYEGLAPSQVVEGVLRKRFETALGDRYDDFVIGLSVSSGIRIIGESYLVADGCAPHVCNIHESFFSLNIATDKLLAATTINESVEVLIAEDLSVSQTALNQYNSWAKKFTDQGYKVILVGDNQKRRVGNQ